MTFMESGVVAIIGPESSETANVVSGLAQGLQIPLVSFSATDPTLCSMEYPFVVQTTQNDRFQMDAIADIINYFGWREITAIYTDDSYGRNGIASLGDKLAENQCRITYKAPMSPEPNEDDIRGVLFRVISEESRVLVLHTNDYYGLKVLKVARSLQMLERGFVWIATNWLIDIIDTDPSLSSDAMSDVQGLLTLRAHTPNSQLKKNFMARWSDLVKRKHSNVPFGLNTYGLYAYDTVWVIASALDAFLSQGGNLSFTKFSTLNHLKVNYTNLHLDSIRISNGGEKLLSDIYQVNRTGLTGHIQFDQDRHLINPAFEILNVVGTGLNTVGYWSNFSGLSAKPPGVVHDSKPPGARQHLSSVIWPGQSTERPRGWVYSNNGKVLRIGVPRRVTYLEFVSYSAQTNSFTGYSIDVFTAALNLLPYGVSYKLIPFGDGKSNPNIDDLINNMSSGVSAE